MPILVIFGDKMANLGPINFKIGLYIKVNVNYGKTNLKSISKNIWPKWPLIAQNRPDATLADEH